MKDRLDDPYGSAKAICNWKDQNTDQQRLTLTRYDSIAKAKSIDANCRDIISPLTILRSCMIIQ
jgi:hypothetical protein